MSYSPNRATIVTVAGDHLSIQTDQRRASAILMVLSGATLAQVGKKLSVSRERIRQYLVDAQLTTKMRTPLFAQVHHKTAAAERFRRGLRREIRRYARRQKRIRQAVEAIRAFQQSRGRVPTYYELFRLVRPGIRLTYKAAGPRLASWLGRHGPRPHIAKHYGKQGRALQALYRLAGFPELRVGRWTGKPRKKRTHCRRGHLLSPFNTTYVWQRTRRCRTCQLGHRPLRRQK